MNRKKGFTKITDQDIYYEILQPELLDEKNSCLVFLHEGLGSVGQWKDFPSLLSEITNLPALIYDRLGHGKSFKLNHKRRLSFMEEEASLYLPQLLQNLNISHSLILVGHSDGGTISLLTGVFSGLPLEGIISMAAHTYVEEITILGIKEAVQAFQNGRLRSSLEKYHSENTESMFYAWADTWLSPDMRNFDIRKLMSHIRVPCLAIQGKYDQYGSVNQVFSITDAVSENGMPILLDNCGHIPHIQAKDLVLKACSDFISKINAS